MNTLDRRQIIILAAFCLPLFSLIFVSYTGVGQSPVPKIPEKRSAPTGQTAPNPFKPFTKPLALAAERERVRGLLKEANSMTPEQYLLKQKTEPTFAAPDINVRRSRLTRRLEQLEHMTEEQWEAEQRSGVILAPSPSSPVNPAPTPNPGKPFAPQTLGQTPLSATPPATDR